MHLFLFRHGEAGEAPTDAQRTLTDKGRKQTRLSSTALKVLGKSIDVILYSPLPRAAQTGEIASTVLQPEFDAHPCEALAPPADFEHLFETMLEFSSAKDIMLVGHMPSLGDLISQIVWGETLAEIPIKKAGIAMLELERLRYRERGSLRWLLTAKQLALIAKNEK